MRALVVYESMFGNTKAVARAIAAGLSEHLDVETVEVSTAPSTIGDDLDLVVVGGPTHAFGMSRQRTRQSAGTQTNRPLVSVGTGLREWLTAQQFGRATRGGCAAVAFDTRVGKSWVPGSAARAVEGRLRRRGFRVVATAESFWVDGTLGPLRDGEQERARRWGARLASELIGFRRTRSWVGEVGHAVL